MPEPVPRDSAARPGDAPARAPRPSWQTIVLACWVLGVGGCAELSMRKRARYRALIDEARPVAEADMLAVLRACCAQFQIRRPVRIVTANTPVSPFTLGILRPVIYIPHHLLRADQCVLYAIIAHESIHIKRYDVVWMNLQHLAQIGFFFFPVVWHVNRQIELARECICDRAVVAGGAISTAEYGASLLLVLKGCFANQASLPFLPSFNPQYRILKDRIRRLKTYARRRPPRSAAMYAVLCMFGVVALPMAPHMARIAFFTPFHEAERQMFHTLEQRLVTPYAAAYSPTLTSMRYTGVGLQGEFAEPVYAIGAGEVARITGDAPHAEVVVAHTFSGRKRLFSVYAHLADVQVQVGDPVTEHTRLGRLLTREEFVGSGFAEQHLHLEVRRTLDAYRSRSPHYLKYETADILESGFVNPLMFYRKHLHG